jgi:hypothetical protein
MSNEDWSAALVTLQENIWNIEFREYLQLNGVVVSPSNFYSSIPTIKEIHESFEYKETHPPYLDDSLFNTQFLNEHLLALLPCVEGFFPPMEISDAGEKKFYFNNSQFSYSDAFSYYGFIKKLNPNTVFEIGSGYSSLIASEALLANKKGKLVCVEPFPRQFIEDMADKSLITLKKLPVQQITSEMLNEILCDGDILFIDSTHTVKTGSDCLHIYLRLLPNIRKKIFIHVHDIFLPFGFPKNWMLEHQLFWTEQYLLLAFLKDNPKVKVIFGSAYHKVYSPDLLDKLMGSNFPSGGSSFWFEYDGRIKI